MTKTIPINNLPLWEKAKKNRTLLRLNLELTCRCNNNCIHCYNNLPENDINALENELSTKQIKDIIDQAVDLGLLWLLLTGGEIFLRKDFIDLYLYMKKKGLLISLFTNATLITKEHAELFRQYPPRDIEISVYGVSKTNYGKVTRTNNFSQFIAGVDNLREASIPFSLKTTVIKANYPFLKDITKFCNEKSNEPHRKFRFDPFLILRTDKNKSRNKDIIEQRLSEDDILKMEKEHADRMEQLVKQCDSISKKNQSRNVPEKLFKCGAGINSCSVDCHGKFRLCSSLVNENCVYDLTTGSLKDAWDNFVPEIRAMSSHKKTYHETCSNCRLRDLCRWCPAVGDIETGEFDEKIDYFCSLSNMRYEYCFKNK